METKYVKESIEFDGEMITFFLNDEGLKSSPVCSVNKSLCAVNPKIFALFESFILDIGKVMYVKGKDESE